MDYKTAKKQAIGKGDRAYCTVMASSVFFNADYEETHKFYAKHGRKLGRGLNDHMTNKLIHKMSKKHGLEIVNYGLKARIISKPQFKRKNQKLIHKKTYRFESLGGEIFIKMSKNLTLKNFNDYIPSGNYIFGISGHVLAVKNGAIQDWTELQNKNGIINRIWAEKYPEFIEDEEIDYSSLC
jgi:hypothetical protein